MRSILHGHGADFAPLLELAESRFHDWNLKEIRPERDQHISDLKKQNLTSGGRAVFATRIYREFLEREVRGRIAFYAAVAHESGSSEMLSKCRIEEYRHRVLASVGVAVGALKSHIERVARAAGDVPESALPSEHRYTQLQAEILDIVNAGLRVLEAEGKLKEQAGLPELHASEGESTTVFVQYAHDSEDHMRSVRTLADRLRGDVIEAVVDQYVENPPEGWPSWMERQLREANFVLVVCSPANERRFSKQEEVGKGLGATWEGHLIQQILYDGGARNDRFIPVLLTPDHEQFIPVVLRAYTRYRLYETGGYEKLVARLTGRVPQPPPVGPSRATAPHPKKNG